MDCLLVPSKDATCLSFAEKTSVNSHKTSIFEKVFSLKSLPAYSIKTEEYETSYNSINSDQHQHLTGLITYQIKYGVNLDALTCYELLTSLLSCRQSHSQASLVSQQYWNQKSSKKQRMWCHCHVHDIRWMVVRQIDVLEGGQKEPNQALYSWSNSRCSCDGNYLGSLVRNSLSSLVSAYLKMIPPMSTSNFLTSCM